MMKSEKGSARRRFALGTWDKVFLGALGVLLVLIIALSIMERCGLMPINGGLAVFLPLLAIAVLLGWGVFALIRRIRKTLVKALVGGVLGLVLLLALALAFTYISYMSFYVTPQRYTTITSPTGAHRLVVMRAFDTDDDRVEVRKAARLAGAPSDDEETRVEDWGFIYRAYPQVLGLFYRANADVEGEVYLAITDLLAGTEAAEGEAAESAPHGTLMVEWLDDESTAHFFVKDPGAAEGGECWVRF